MTVVRYDPPKQPKAGVGGFVKSAARFLANPIVATVGGLAQAATQDTRVDEWVYWTVPVEVDTEAGTVSLDKSAARRFMSGKGGPQRVNTSKQMTQADAALPLLQRAYETGQVPSGVPSSYSEIAAAIARLEKPAAVSAPAAPDQPFEQYGDSMPIIPPGGFAGFSQMTPASKLALVGKRGVSGGKRKRRRKAKAAKKPRKRAKARKSGKKLAKGSAAAKRRMAKLRAMRK